MLFVYSLDFTRTRLASDAKDMAKGGQRQFTGMIDVYRKTLASDGILGFTEALGPRSLALPCIAAFILELMIH